MFGLKPRNEERAIDPSSWGQAWGDSVSGDTWSGASVSQSTAMQLLTVYGCAQFIADGIATLPWCEYRVMGGVKEEIDPITPWLEQPTADLSRVDWTVQVLMSLLLAGNAYVDVSRISDREVVATPLDPQKVTVSKQNGRTVFSINGIPQPNREIYHLKGLMMPGTSVGVSPVELARQTIGSGLSAEEFSGRFFGQGMSLAGVVEAKGPMPPEGPGSPKDMARQFARLHSGKSKAHLPAVLVDATWKATGVTAEQAQFLETRKFTASQIAGLMFLIDPTDLGIPVDGTSLTYANLEQRNARRVQVTYMRWIIRIERLISTILARGRYMKMDLDELLRGDLTARYNSYKVASEINATMVGLGDQPFMLTSEMRDFEDLDAITASNLAAPATTTPVQSNSSPQQINVHNHPANLHVDGVDVRVDAPAAPNVTMPAPVVNIEPAKVEVIIPDIRADIPVTINMPEQAPPVVNVHVDAPTLPFPQPTRRATVKTINRDAEGNIASIVET